jgi:chaperonin cofactor prefoldin
LTLERAALLVIVANRAAKKDCSAINRNAVQTAIALMEKVLNEESKAKDDTVARVVGRHRPA